MQSPGIHPPPKGERMNPSYRPGGVKGYKIEIPGGQEPWISSIRDPLFTCADGRFFTDAELSAMDAAVEAIKQDRDNWKVAAEDYRALKRAGDERIRELEEEVRKYKGMWEGPGRAAIKLAMKAQEARAAAMEEAAKKLLEPCGKVKECKRDYQCMGCRAEEIRALKEK